MKFGIEFEFNDSFEIMKPIARQAIKTYYDQKSYTYRTASKKKWVIKPEQHDTSELNTPVSTKDDIEKICKVLRYCNKHLTVSNETGMHVHIDLKEKNLYKIINAWLAYEKSIFSFFPNVRHQNNYCFKRIDRSNYKKRIGEISKKIIESEYKGSIFYCSYYNTVEFRLSHSDYSTKWIRTWLNFLFAFVKHSQRIEVDNLLPNQLDFNHLIYSVPLHYQYKRHLTELHLKYHKLKY